MSLLQPRPQSTLYDSGKQPLKSVYNTSNIVVYNMKISGCLTWRPSNILRYSWSTKPKTKELVPIIQAVTMFALLRDDIECCLFSGFLKVKNTAISWCIWREGIKKEEPTILSRRTRHSYTPWTPKLPHFTWSPPPSALKFVHKFCWCYNTSC
jgi:hypothetical protein